MKFNEKKLNIKFNILAVICILIFCFALTPKTLQNDTFYTIRIGELISNNGIDMMDHFSNNEDLPYTYPHWAYDTVIYQIFNLGEMSGIEDGGMLFIYISTIVLTMILGTLMYFTCSKVCKNNLVAFFVTLRSFICIKNIYCSKSTTCNIYIICLNNFIYRKFLGE